MLIRRLTIVAASVLVALTTSSTARSAEVRVKREYREPHMGVDVHLTLYAGAAAVANDAAAQAFARIAELNGIFSDYDPDSEAMRLCRSATPGEPQTVSDDLWQVLLAAQALGRRSDGAFDVTIGPLTKLWRRARRRYELPDPQSLAEARERVGWKHLTIDPEQPFVTLHRRDLQFDFGGIVKGYAAEAAVRVLKAEGVPRALVAIDGDIAAGDAPPDQPGWRIGVAPLDATDRTPSVWLNLVNASVSTAGDAFQYVEIGGVRYSHIVDPRTGLGLTTRSSVTVVARHGITADGLDTTAVLLEPEARRKLIEETAAAGLLVTVRDGKAEVLRTRGLEGWLWPME